METIPLRPPQKQHLCSLTNDVEPWLNAFGGHLEGGREEADVAKKRISPSAKRARYAQIPDRLSYKPDLSNMS